MRAWVKNMKLAIATNNQHKLQEIKAILGDSFDQLLSLKDLGIDVDVEETGSTLEENALIKARAILALANIPTLADDTGLMVDALDGAPGVYSARYAGPEHDDAKIARSFSRIWTAQKTAPLTLQRSSRFAIPTEKLSPQPDAWTARFCLKNAAAKGSDTTRFSIPQSLARRLLKRHSKRKTPSVTAVAR